MLYPITEFDSLGARQEPPEEVYEEIDETADYDKDSMGETIAQEDGVFQVYFVIPLLELHNKRLVGENKKAIVTQQDIVDFIEEIGEEKITSINFLGLGENYLKTGGKENE